MSKDDGGLGALKAGLASFSRLFDHRAVIQGTYLVLAFKIVRIPVLSGKISRVKQLIYLDELF